jgi:hypothetical protein
VVLGNSIYERSTPPDFPLQHTSATKLSVPAPLTLIANFPVFPAVTSDGQRFLVSVPAAQNNGPQQFTVVLNWPALRKK